MKTHKKTTQLKRELQEAKKEIRILNRLVEAYASAWGRKTSILDDLAKLKSKTP